MALVGEAKIRVVADTSKVKQMIQDGFAGLDKEAEKTGNNVNKSFNKGMSSGGAGKGFSKFQKESMEMSKQFHKAIRSSYKWQAASGALLQSLMALGGGILALAGNIAGAASAGIALVGMMAQIKVASLVAKQAFKGIMAAVKKDSKSAAGATKTIKELREEMQQLAFAAEQAALSEEAASIKLEKAREDLARVSNLPPDNRARREAQLAYSEAELAYRKAKDKNADAQDELLNPKKKKKKGEDPYKDLTKSQKDFALYLKDVMPAFKDLNEAAAGGFLPELTKQMKVMFAGDFFGRLTSGFADVSMGLGKATKNFAGTLFDPQNKENLSAFFKNAGTTTGTLGTVLGKVFSGFLALMRAINPLVTRFTSFLETKSTNFAKNMQGDFANVQAFFKDAGDAAAQWGGILGRIFGKFKEMIKANIGPGTGGQLLLDFFDKGTAGFRGLDGAAGEFARKQHFLASATNLKAMLESIGKIFSFMSDLGTDPAVASFWTILADLEGPLSTIFENLQGSSDELASLLVTIVEIVASFADSGQLNAYMVLLNDIFKILNGIVMSIAPVMQQFGGLIGKIGALVTTFLLLKKVTMLVYGSFLFFKGIVVGVKVAMIAFKAVQVGLLAIQEASNAAVAVGNVLSKQQSLQLMVGAIRSAFSATAKSADAAGNVMLGTTAAGALPAVIALGVAVVTATWPILLIVAAIAAAVAIFAIWTGHMNAVKADKIKVANKEIQDSFKATKGEIIGAAEAQTQWTSAISATTDPINPAIKNIKDVGKAYEEGEQKIKDYLKQGNYYAALTEAQTGASHQATEGLHLYMNNLKGLAKKDLPESQRQLRNMAVAGNISREMMLKSIDMSKGYTKELEKQANAMGDTIYNADGTVNAMKRLDYAIGEGSYLRQKAILEQQKLTETFKNAVGTFVDSNDAMQKATTNGKTSLSKYSSEMKKQTDTLTAWRGNISKISAQFKDKTLVNDLIAQGSAGAGLVATLAEGGQKAVDQYEKVQKAMLKAKQDADNYTKAFSSTAAILKVYKEEWNFSGSTGESKVRAFQKDIEDGMGVFELKAKYNISEEKILAAQRKLDSGADLANNVSLTAKWDQKSLDDAKKALNDTMGVSNWKIMAGDPKDIKDGGHIVSRALGGIVGRVANFADGFGPNYNGRVSGPGTGRSDQIPAMISNGEFVVNARATASNLDLLNAINNNRGVGGMAGNQIAITVNAAPGMDEQQVAAQVARQLDAQLSRGGSL